jgi:alpha-ribazole phosphatase
MATEVWLVRHTAVDVPAGTCYGRTDVPLRRTFPAEAAEVWRALAGARFDEVWSSPLSRCTRLATACGFASPRLDDRLMEIDFGEWETRRWDEIQDPALALWYADYLHARPTGGESFGEQRARVAAFLEELRGQAAWPAEELRERPAELKNELARQPEASSETAGTRRALVFTHGGVMVAAGLHARLFTEAEAFDHVPPHGSIMKIEL